MKYIVIGLGNFGFPLAEKLTKLGNEVIGIDRSSAKRRHARQQQRRHLRRRQECGEVGGLVQ